MEMEMAPTVVTGAIRPQVMVVSHKGQTTLVTTIEPISISVTIAVAISISILSLSSIYRIPCTLPGLLLIFLPPFGSNIRIGMTCYAKQI